MERQAPIPSRARLLAPTAQRRISLENQGLATVTSAPTSAHAAKTAPNSKSENAVVIRKVDEILRRMLPHSIVQSYQKVTAAVKAQVVVAVNGEPLAAVERESGLLSAQWKAQQEKPPAPPHPLHYARMIQYATARPQLSLNESFKTLEVTVTSLATNTSINWFQSPTPVLTKKNWKLVAETDRKIGLALYELAMGPWNASSLIVLVWAKTLEVVNIYAQLHVAELLYGCPPRGIRILPDDVDTKYGLHSFTAAVTIRNLSRVLWETECYGVEFPAPVASKATVIVGLLDEESGHRDRGRFISAAVATLVATDPIAVSVESAIAVDVTVWEASCQPVWAFTRLLPITTREAAGETGNFSMSVAGGKRQLLEVAYCDSARGNAIQIHFEKSDASSTAKNKSVFVKQITLEFATAFINKTFSTNYPIALKR